MYNLIGFTILSTIGVMAVGLIIAFKDWKEKR
jgi:hypothetical protein